jgi:Sec-independent protein translocase protein TatA
MEKMAADGWNLWLDSRLKSLADGLGGALGKARQQLREEQTTAIDALRAELLTAIDTAKAEILDQVRAEIATAIEEQKRSAQLPLALSAPGWVGTA